MLNRSVTSAAHTTRNTILPWARPVSPRAWAFAASLSGNTESIETLQLPRRHELDRRASVTLLPHPVVNMVFDRGRVTLAGPGSDRFTYVYEGAGRVFGVKFRPGAFRPFLRGPVSALTDRTAPLSA